MGNKAYRKFQYFVTKPIRHCALAAAVHWCIFKVSGSGTNWRVCLWVDTWKIHDGSFYSFASCYIHTYMPVQLTWWKACKKSGQTDAWGAQCTKLLWKCKFRQVILIFNAIHMAKNKKNIALDVYEFVIAFFSVIRNKHTIQTVQMLVGGGGCHILHSKLGQ